MKTAMLRPLAALAVVALSGCGLLEAATDVPFGAGEIDRVEQTVAWPDPDLIAPPPDPPPPGYPATLEDATLAHLIGAMVAGGVCHTEAVGQVGGSLKAVLTTVTRCGLGDRCAERCPADFEGVWVTVDATLQIVSEEKAREVNSLLSETDESAIVQVRLRFFDLNLYQGDGDARVRLDDRLNDFTFGLRDVEGNALDLVKLRHLPDIRPDTPQRFALNNRDPLTRALKKAVLSGRGVELGLHVAAGIPPHALYGVKLRPAGFLIDTQPELVISVLDVATGGL